MCGIAGFLNFNGLNAGAESMLAPMLERIHHRGPDGRGMHLDLPNGVAMGHTRLSIIDLHTGDQPIAHNNGRQVLTVNGEFYDFKKYRSTAMAEGERFMTKADSEIALSLYRKYGRAFVEHLRGEFAFTLYDRDKEEFILVRDRFGVRPLFFYNNGREFVYGSEIKSVLAHPSVPRELDPQGVLHNMMQTIVPGTSAFKDIVAIEPGQMLIVKKGKHQFEIETHTYWDFDFPTIEEREERDPQEYIEAVRAKLIESISLRLEADVPVGCYLSGGIDSCCILGLATGAMQSPIKAFTISFDDDAYDESSIAKLMSDSMQADQEQINLGAEDLYGENFIRTVWHTERSFYNTLGVAKYLMSQRVHQCNYKTVITGEGADELFAGYPALKRDMFLHGLNDEPASIRQEYQRLLEQSNSIFKGAILADKEQSHPHFDRLCGFTPSWIQPWISTLALAKPLLSDHFQRELKDYDPIAAIAEKIDGRLLEGRHALDKAQYTWSKCQLEGQILNWGGDRVDMANSMESRPAFLDHHLADLAVQIPPHYRIKGNTEKWVLREAVRGVLPEVLYKREKFAFMAPPAHTSTAKQNKVNELIERFLSPSELDKSGLFSPAAVQKFLSDYRSDKDRTSLTQKDTILNHMLCLQIMHHQFIENF